MRRLEAVLAATVVTGVIALCMIVVGLNALFNPSPVRASDVPGSAGVNAAEGALNSAPAAEPDQAQVKELQSEISQYQQQLDQANAQIQQYQQVLEQLQQSGVIRITRDGRILLRVPSGDDQ